MCAMHSSLQTEQLEGTDLKPNKHPGNIELLLNYVGLSYLRLLSQNTIDWEA